MSKEAFKKLINEIEWLDADLSGKDFLSTSNRNTKELHQVAYTSVALKWLWEDNISTRCFDSGLALRYCPDKSPEPGFPFSLAANMLGLTVQELNETGAPVSFFSCADIIGIQHTAPGDPDNTYIKDIAESLDKRFESNQTQRPGIINLQCETDIAEILKETGVIYPEDREEIAVGEAYQPYIIASMILNNRFRQPAKVLEKIKKRNTPRRIL